MTGVADLYQILGVRKGANLAEIRRAYQKRARALHPSLNPGDAIAAERFRTLVHAFEVLSDPQRRGAYDRGEPVAAKTPSPPEVGFEGFDFSAELRVSRMGFREIFGAAGEGSPPGPEPGEDLEQTARLSFEESLGGTRRRFHLTRQESCPVCQGAGDVSQAPVPCGRCGGTGRIQAGRGHLIFSRACPGCGGAGALARRPCGRCEGGGRVMLSEWLEVQVPPGAGEGSRLRIPGGGNAGRRGGPPGDLVLILSIDAHPLFRREGDDLHCGVPITFAEAAAGAHVEVPTPDGAVTIEVPAGTQNGQRFRLRKRGVPRPEHGTRGDLWVEVRVTVPTVTEERGRELLAELARLHPENPRRALGPLSADAKGRA
jgi:molecular chaperone DnaJ